MKWISILVLIIALAGMTPCLYGEEGGTEYRERAYSVEGQEVKDTREIDPGPLFNPAEAETMETHQIDPGPIFNPADESELPPADVRVESINEPEQETQETEEAEEQATPINIP